MIFSQRSLPLAVAQRLDCRRAGTHDEADRVIQAGADAVGNSDLGCISEAEQKELLMGWMAMVQQRRNQGRLTDI